MQPEGNHVMFPAEAEAYIQDLETMGVANIASEKSVKLYIYIYIYIYIYPKCYRA